jgi:V/A-type H+-transporting ATPase subunit D
MLKVAPTKSNLLSLKRQLAFAEEGFDLLEQKRQILIRELMSRLGRAREAEREVAEAMRPAFAALREATLDIGSENLDRAALGVRMSYQLSFSPQRLMGLSLPRLTLEAGAVRAQFGVGGTSANADLAMRRFVEALPVLTELAEIETGIVRLARELRRTQRRCNALSKILIPEYRQTLAFIAAALEEREREGLVILKMIRNRLAQPSRQTQSS